MKHSFPIVLLLGSLSFWGCANDVEMDAAPPLPSSGCGSTAPQTGVQQVVSDGVNRTYYLDIPSQYDSQKAYPVVFGFHGMTTSGEQFRSQWYGNLLSAMGDEAIVVHPDALGDPTAWESGLDSADVTFFDDMLAQLKSTLCVDENRIFATGHSSGGYFTNTLGCARGNVLRGIAPVSGGGPWGGTCTGQVAAWVIHATNDETVKVSQGEGSRDNWGAANSCDMNTSSPVAPTGCVAYADCDPNYPVVWCTYTDGHNWPAIAPEGMWNFFKSL